MESRSQTCGVKPMAIAGRTVRERERLLGMTDEERAWRAQWLKDQILSPNEPRHVPELERELRNPLRRFYRWPLDTLEQKLVPKYGEGVKVARNIFGKSLLVLTAMFYMTYNLKYHHNDWTRMGGWRILESRHAVVPGDANYPAMPDRHKPSDYGSRGFNDCKLNFK